VRRPIHHSERSFAIPPGRMKEFQASGYRHLDMGGRLREPMVDNGWIVWIPVEEAVMWLREDARKAE
jgi:hypothetical protein